MEPSIVVLAVQNELKLQRVNFDFLTSESCKMNAKDKRLKVSLTKYWVETLEGWLVKHGEAPDGE